jgi:hypothetical protein
MLTIEQERDALEWSVVASDRQARRSTRDNGLNLEQYRTNPIAYVETFMGFSPWSGRNGRKGQRELYEDIADSVRRQLEGDTSATRRFRVESCHGVGKTYGAAGLVNWFFDCFRPSITMTTAPSTEQVELLLWKDIRTMRSSSPELPGRLYSGMPRLTRSANWFAMGRAVSNAGGQGTARFQGQHGRFLFFLVDEAEGVDDYVFDAIDAMMTGGEVVLALFLANPMTRASAFYRLGRQPNVLNYRLDALEFPNVLDNASTIPGATDRRWVNERIAKYCQIVSSHDEDRFTFAVPWDVPWNNGDTIPAGTIFLPDDEFLFRVRGIPPVSAEDNVLIPAGRYEAAVKRGASATRDDLATWAFIGIDCARYGNDAGTIYLNFCDVVSREAEIRGEDSLPYLHALLRLLEGLPSTVERIELRLDGTGGYASGIADGLKLMPEVSRRFKEFLVIEVNFEGVPSDPMDSDTPLYDDKITELYAEAAKNLHTIAIARPPQSLEVDLTNRPYRYVLRTGEDHKKHPVKKLMPKEKFKKDFGRSPDDGDGFVLCAAPSYCFPPARAAKSVDLRDLFR